MNSPVEQYHELKSRAPGCVLIFRVGDFYELIYDDAETASRALGLTVTTRRKGTDAVPMAGFPYHQLDTYLRRLIQAGYRAAVCEVMEDKTAPRVRSVERVVMPPARNTEATGADRRPKLAVSKSQQMSLSLTWDE